MAIGNVEHMQVFFQLPANGNSKKYDKATEEVDEIRIANMEEVQWARTKEFLTA